MAVFSSLRSSLTRAISLNGKNVVVSQTRLSGGGGHNTMVIQPSRWQWQKCKDLLHFYFFLGAIPLAILTFYANVYIGPAKLAPIPEGYTPKHWEYYPHPISRWLARNVFTSPQQEYEKFLHKLYEEDEMMKIRALEKKIKEKMKERADFQAYYYLPVPAKHIRIGREENKETARILGVREN